MRCTVTGTLQGDHRRAGACPATVPMLHPAWNLGRIDRPSSRSTAAPCTFIATSQAPLPKPNRNSPPPPRECPPPPAAAATTTMPATAAHAIVITVRISPIQPISRPDREVPRAELDRGGQQDAARARREPDPSSARTWGIREAQVA